MQILQNDIERVHFFPNRYLVLYPKQKITPPVFKYNIHDSLDVAYVFTCLYPHWLNKQSQQGLSPWLV